MLYLLCLLFSAQADPAYYPTSYAESKDHFYATYQNLKKQYMGVEHSVLHVPTTTSANLTIDTIYIPQVGDKVERLFVLTSGIHGVEAYTGSAIQFEFLKNLKETNILENVGILVVHAINPYGYHFNRRVSENNVDLNRNLSATQNNFHNKSKTYEKFDDFLNPQTKASSSLFSSIRLFLKSIYHLILFGKKQLTQIIVGGQYQNSLGIYFGGKKHEPHRKILMDEFLRVGRDYKKILHIDLHTGYGERGKLHLFSNTKVKQLNGFNKLFYGFSVDTGADNDFYETSGSFDFFTINTFKDKQVIPMTFEFGTMNSQNILGGFFSLQNMIRENQGFQQGYFNAKSKQDIHNNFMEMFNPSDSTWREQVLIQAKNTIKTIIQRFSEL